MLKVVQLYATFIEFINTTKLWIDRYGFIYQIQLLKENLITANSFVHTMYIVYRLFIACNL